MNMKWMIGVATLAIFGSMWATEGHAARPPKGAYIPPTNMVVNCGGQTTVTANVPSRTKFVQYTFYKPDPVYNPSTYDPNDIDAFFGFEGGPGWPAPFFPYATHVGTGSVPVSTPSGATFVWAEAMTREGAKPLAWGFATCFSNPPIRILINSGSAQLLYYDGSFTIL